MLSRRPWSRFKVTPNWPRRLEIAYSDIELRNRILGGWLGRCTGCQLGKPVEGWTYDQIRDHLERLERLPLDNYFSEKIFSAKEREEWPAANSGSMREHLRIAERDDDQDYTILGISILEELGVNFTNRAGRSKWQLTLPYQQVYTAERQLIGTWSKVLTLRKLL